MRASKKGAAVIFGCLVAATGGVAAGQAVVSDGPPPDDPREMTPQPGTEQRAVVRDDPHGGPPWAATASRSQAGDHRCVSVDRLKDGRRGAFHEGDGGFTPRQNPLAEVCDVPREAVYNVETRVSPADGSVTVVLVGVAGDGVDKVFLGEGEAKRELEITSHGAFLEVFSVPEDAVRDIGDRDMPWLAPYPLSAFLDDGSTKRYPLAG